jgi:type IV pilus assembly protein PilM
MSSLGVYFGPKAIEIVETKGKRLLNHSCIPQSAISAGELEEKVPIETKVIEIVALLKEELRKSKIEAGQGAISLSGRDLIIRNFEIPLLPPEELHSAINFEVKKYIPFRAEDIISDFQLKYDKSRHTKQVLFMGVKKDVLDKYISILSQLDLKIIAIEYSAFSLSRCLKLAGLADTGVVGILGVDLSQEDEVNFTVLENGFPLFSRDIALVGGPEEFPGVPLREAGANLRKLKTEIRTSLDYYQRKFPQKTIKKLFLISNPDSRSDLETIMMDTGLAVEFVGVDRIIKRPPTFSLSFLKSYSASLSKTIKTNVKVNLLAAKAKAIEKEEVKAEAIPVSLFKGLSLDFRCVFLGVMILITTFSLGLYRTQLLKEELSRIVGMRTEVSTVSPEASFEQLTAIESEYKTKVDALNNLVEKQLYFTELLDSIPRLLPRGVWFTNLSFKKSEEAKIELSLEGWAFLADGSKEFAAVNEFVAKLKQDPKFSRYLPVIEIDSLRREQISSRTATKFFIRCRNY